jgi:hypothetical protein
VMRFCWPDNSFDKIPVKQKTKNNFPFIPYLF